MSEDITRQLIKKLGKTNSFALKGLTTVLLSDHFFKIFYDNAERNNNYSGRISLSFDLDYKKDIEALPLLLDRLEHHKIKASFACIGMLIEQFPEEHKQILNYGHEILNHTYSHPFHEGLNIPEHFNLLPVDKQREEIVKCHNTCVSLLDYEPLGMRIPHFAIQHTNNIYNILNQTGYKYSSSILATQSGTFGVPYTFNDVIEFPVTTSPKLLGPG